MLSTYLQDILLGFPAAPSVNLKTDGTASFAGNVTAALGPPSSGII